MVVARGASAHTSRPDIAFAVSTLSQFRSAPGNDHWLALKQLLRYLAHTDDLQVVLGGSSLNLHAFTDASYGDNYNDKSSEGYVVCLGNHLLSWTSKKQKIVALSTTEAAYMALTEAGKEIIWLTSLLTDFGIK